ncbi:hypothetical protein ACFU3O_10355 [Streptomyces antibioticus]|uniref:Pepco domain-containing protein n=1 Tax=Streptomyces antibioticus TaxID=1890 RepID=UPI0036BC7FFC
MTDGQILVLTAAPEAETDADVPAKGWGRAPDPAAAAVAQTAVSSGELGRRLNQLVGQISQAVDHADTAAGEFGVDEVQVSVTVTADGKLALLGAGLGASATATLQLTLRRRSPTGAG